MVLYFVLSVLDRDKTAAMTALYESVGLPVVLSMLGYGTAKSEHLDLYGLEPTDKVLVAAIADGDSTRKLFREAKRKLFIDIPGNGVMLAVPVKSMGGGRTLAYLTNNAAADNSRPDITFDHELLVVILNQNYTDSVMEAARSAGAGGGTVLHAKGTGAKYAEKFFGVSLAEEKEVVLIVADSVEKGNIMRAVMEQAGPGTPAGAIVFSLPVSTVAGLRVLESDDNE